MNLSYNYHRKLKPEWDLNVMGHFIYNRHTTSTGKKHHDSNKSFVIKMLSEIYTQKKGQCLP